MNSKVDLHTHTTASDGALTPEQLVARAAYEGLQVVAITDHDSTAGISAAMKAAEEYGLEVIPGIELGTTIPLGKVHILGYFIDPFHPILCQELWKLRAARIERAQQMVRRLAALGCPIEWIQVVETARGGAIGRPHIAQALWQAGYVSTIQGAFDLYISGNGPAYVARSYKLTPVEAVELIRRAGGVAVLAHPLTMNDAGDYAAAQPLSLLPALCEAGLAGLETYYPGYPSWARATLERVARYYNLVVAGGSDFHGETIKPDNLLGGVAVPLWCVEELKSRTNGEWSNNRHAAYVLRGQRVKAYWPAVALPTR